jgi:uncharacterized protein YrrD
MLVSVRDLGSYTIGATDGDIGSVEDVYFDQRRWTVRYLLVDTGAWLPGRKVLVSPMSVQEPDWAGQRLPVNLSRAQVEGSPELDPSAPITPQHEALFSDYYRLPLDWASPGVWGAAPYPAPVPAVEPEAARALEREGWTDVGPEHREPGVPREGEDDPRVRSAREVTGYEIQAADAELGEAEDFLVDPESWTIRYLVIDTGRWLPGRRVLVAPDWISLVSWTDRKVHVNLTRAEIEASPPYEPGRAIDRAYEAALHEHYGRPRYWEERDRAA